MKPCSPGYFTGWLIRAAIALAIVLIMLAVRRMFG